MNESHQAEELASALCGAFTMVLHSGELDVIPDAALRRVLVSAIKLYAAKAEAAGHDFAPFDSDQLTATQAAVTACAIIRAAGLNLFDIAMWFGRPVDRPRTDTAQHAA
jgi:hypothetical protein